MKTTRSLPFCALALAAILAAGCGGDEAGTSGSGATPAKAGDKTSASGASRVQADDVADAVTVYDAKKKESGTDVAVYGRVANEVEGQGAFTLVDVALPYCGEEEAEGCPTPWDYCCHPDELPGASLPVEIRDADGEVVTLPEGDLRRLDLIVVTGRIESTESGGQILVARGGFHRRERPDLPDNLAWPD